MHLYNVKHDPALLCNAVELSAQFRINKAPGHLQSEHDCSMQDLGVFPYQITKSKCEKVVQPAVTLQLIKLF